MYSYEYFFEVPGEFDEQIENLKEAISSSIQKKFLNEMEQLRKENESLRYFRDKKEECERELKKAKDEYERKTREAERNADKKKLKELLYLLAATGYRVDSKYKKGPKCDKCDDKRKIHFVSPMGRQMEEDCSCAKSTVFYYPKEVPIISFSAGRELGNVYFERTDGGYDYDSYSLCADLYDKKQEPYEKLNWYHIVFLKEEDCRKYCDWLNEQEKKKEGEEKSEN